ncbi:hypothetical protein HYPSUDRAFT_206556 [Hypholoma sublateritium FD-334 SS-4]|uniref:Uncharacterized protein n=1 Tax=Hypholoma sublateritium (strain FD-334 SS-4) TaxID=945553 RepID=A0A0D2M1E1_HYPSF|nr:hypothetical protein HYPSUDRAFT_206556 [Hypholoma sublateritium FD-334 SS-4]
MFVPCLSTLRRALTPPPERLVFLVRIITARYHWSWCRADEPSIHQITIHINSRYSAVRRPMLCQHRLVRLSASALYTFATPRLLSEALSVSCRAVAPHPTDVNRFRSASRPANPASRGLASILCAYVLFAVLRRVQIPHLLPGRCVAHVQHGGGGGHSDFEETTGFRAPRCTLFSLCPFLSAAPQYLLSALLAVGAHRTHWDGSGQRHHWNTEIWWTASRDIILVAFVVQGARMREAAAPVVVYQRQLHVHRRRFAFLHVRPRHEGCAGAMAGPEPLVYGVWLGTGASKLRSTTLRALEDYI